MKNVCDECLYIFMRILMFSCTALSLFRMLKFCEHKLEIIKMLHGFYTISIKVCVCLHVLITVVLTEKKKNGTNHQIITIL